MAKKRDYTTLYKGRGGQWTWVFHRVTGVAVILFLFAHIVDTAVIGWGEEAYDRVMAAYENPIVRLMEMGLVLAVLYHAINGVRIMITDFWPQTVDKSKQLFWGTIVVFFAAAIPIVIIMTKQAVDLL
jgi:succinate dehydrogenase / fumarate reductase, cytochrome b subunit